MSAEFVAHMEDVPDPVSGTGQALYAEPYDPHRPVVCFDETSTQLLADARPALPTSQGFRCVRTTSTGGKGPATCFWPVNLWRGGGRWR